MMSLIDINNELQLKSSAVGTITLTTSLPVELMHYLSICAVFHVTGALRATKHVRSPMLTSMTYYG